MEIQHFSHKKHPLRYVEVLQKVDDDEEVAAAVCYGCGQPVLLGIDGGGGGRPSYYYYYTCGECKLFLHKRCAEMPETLTHGVHPEHPLTLFAKPSSIDSGANFRNCNVCFGRSSNFTYHCASCGFSVDVQCAWEEDRQWKHSSHSHPLTLIRQPVSFRCHACGEEAKEQSFRCSTSCGFWIHKSCAMLQRTLKYCDFDDHPLTLSYFLPEKYRDLLLTNCELCKHYLHRSHWVYHCARCRNVFHIRCATSNKDEADDEEDCKPAGLVELPLNSFSELAEQFVERYRRDEGKGEFERPTTITNFSHEHPLTLFENELGRKRNSDGNDEILYCDGCIQPISLPYYGCGECNYFLHLACSRLPAHIENHHLHSQHSMSLNRESSSSSHFPKCDCCRLVTNGFFYECKACQINIDVKCAFLPEVLAHTSHKHPLTHESGSSYSMCHACGGLSPANSSLVCQKCKFRLCYRCVIQPPSIRHRWDKHSIALSYPPYSDHPDDFVCEICEEDIHPKFWMYRCRKCDYSFHLKCIPQLGVCQNTKFGGAYKSSSHPHSLTYVRQGMFKSFCADCGDRVDKARAFECAPCRYCVCYQCFSKEEPESENVARLIRRTALLFAEVFK